MNMKKLLIIVIVAIIGLVMIACEEIFGDTSTVSGIATANDQGKITFQYNKISSDASREVTYTLDLPSPNDKFTVSYITERTIKDLEQGQTVNFSASIDKGKLTIKENRTGFVKVESPR